LIAASFFGGRGFLCFGVPSRPRRRYDVCFISIVAKNAQRPPNSAGKIFLIESVDRTIRAERGGAMSADRFNVNYSFSKNWELLESKYVGTGHPDLTK
jgi:hypothetical protein